MNRVWVMSQDGEKLVLAEQFEIHSAMEVLAEIEDQLRKGSCFDDMYQHRRVSKQNVYHLPKE